jgi:hypothetical protein
MDRLRSAAEAVARSGYREERADWLTRHLAWLRRQEPNSTAQARNLIVDTTTQLCPDMVGVMIDQLGLPGGSVP